MAPIIGAVPLPILPIEPLVDPSTVASSPRSALESLARLRAVIPRVGIGIVCLSGGVDSALVLAVASAERPGAVRALTATSVTLPAEEEQACVRLAESAGVPLLLRPSLEMENPAFVANEGQRCYHCKSELYSIAWQAAAEQGADWVLDGVNMDDLGDHRPGLRAATERGVGHPLVEAGLRKVDVRGVARLLGLSVWDKPAFACLSSRFPYGTPITERGLHRVESLERALRGWGVRQLRVRAEGDTARIEVLPTDIPRLAADPLRSLVVAAAREAGFLFVALDLEGYRMGSLNAALSAGARP